LSGNLVEMRGLGGFRLLLGRGNNADAFVVGNNGRLLGCGSDEVAAGFFGAVAGALRIVEVAARFTAIAVAATAFFAARVRA
jgi:hypothetical protein